MVDVQYALILKVFVVIIALAIAFFFIFPLFGFDLMRYLSMGKEVEDVFQPQDLSNVFEYEDYGYLTHDGMILGRDEGLKDIGKALNERMEVSDCSGCSGCSQAPGFSDIENCSDCDTCNGVTEIGRFRNCISCSNGNCVFCEDYGEEPLLCKEIKSCILEYIGDLKHYKEHGCFLTEIPRSNDTSFNINDLKNVLSKCKNELIKIDIGNNITRELCYFNASSISYYDFEIPKDFYIKKNYSGSGPTTLILYDDKAHFTPFYTIDGTPVEKYRLYVSLKTEPNQIFYIYVGKYTRLPLGLGTSTDYECKLGEVHTDSNGFGYAEFDTIPYDCSNIDDWKAKPEDYPLNGIKIENKAGTPGSVDCFYTFYLNEPLSNLVWSNELTYSNCNFNTNPETYLKDRPWWVINPDNLNSSWNISGGNPNSSIKVYYNSRMPGGEFSRKRRGNIKLTLGRLDTNLLKDCKFDIYVCTQDSFAEQEDENILGITDFFSSFNPANIYKKVTEGNDMLIVYNYFEFDLEKNYTIDEIFSAIETGFRIWEGDLFSSLTFGTPIEWLSSDHNDGIYQDEWNEITGMVNFNKECWNENVENYARKIKGKTVIGSCPNGNCSEKLRMRVAFRYLEPNESYKEPLYPIITFCSKSSCGNGVVDSGEECDTTAIGTPCDGLCLDDCTCPPMYKWECTDFSGGTEGRDNVNNWTIECSDPHYPYAVSCTSENIKPRYSTDDKWNADAIREIVLRDNKCVVSAKDYEGDNEQNRSVCVLCSNKKPEIVWKDFEIIDNTWNFTVESEKCKGTFPFSCLVDLSDDWEYNGEYPNDKVMLTDLYLENGICKSTLRSWGGDDFKGRIGIVCTKYLDYTIKEGNYQEKNDNALEKFTSPNCDPGTRPLVVFSKSNYSNIDNYMEDLINGMYIEGNHFALTAVDSGWAAWWCKWCDWTEQSRKVDVLCINSQQMIGACGNSIIDPGEKCDPGPPLNLNGKTCADLGFTGGTLSCTGNCVFDTGGCTGGGGGGGGGGGCLIEGSEILTPEGFKRIEDIEIGDTVIGYENGKEVEAKVTNKTSHFGFWDIYYYKGYWFTETHKVYPSLNGGAVVVSLLSDVKKQYTGNVYDIKTETHNYFGKNGFLIHNWFVKV